MPVNPLPTLHTPRLQLRPVVLEDEEELFRLWSDPDVVRYTSQTALLREQVNQMVGRWMHYGDEPGHGAWIVLAEGRVAGYAFLRYLLETADTELGYGLDKSFWGQGYMTEAARALIDWSFAAGRTRIVAVAMPENVGSWRVMEKCGMTYEGIRDYRGFMDRWYAIARPTGQR
jgi:ribosomal-protein-alanine N-acetyltransferase